MSDMLVVDFAALQRASSDIQVALNTLHTELDQLERDAGGLVASWDGDARHAYDLRQAQWRRAAADLAAMLGDIRKALDESAADYLQTEKRNASLFE